VDLLDTGISPGDVYIMDENQLTTTGYEDGYLSGRCTILPGTINDNNIYCSQSFTFDEGSIFVAGVSDNLVVVGGTGCFEGIVGEISFQTPETGDLAYRIDESDSVPTNGCSALEDTTWVRMVSELFIDWDRDGSASPGDSYIFEENSVTIPGNGPQGSVAGECMHHQSSSYTDLYCTMTFKFDSGNVVVEGVLNKMIIVAGTGCFFGVSGIISGNIAAGPLQLFSITYDGDDSATDTSCSLDVFDNSWIEPYGESYVDYEFNGEEDNGEIYAYENKVMAVPLLGSATLNGRCIFINDSYYCSYTVELPDGMIHFRGFWEDMTILAGTGCYRDLSGGVSASDPSDIGYVYSFTLSE